MKARLDGAVVTCTALTADDAGLTEENARREDYVDDHSDEISDLATDASDSFSPLPPCYRRICNNNNAK